MIKKMNKIFRNAFWIDYVSKNSIFIMTKFSLNNHDYLFLRIECLDNNKVKITDVGFLNKIAFIETGFDLRNLSKFQEDFLNLILEKYEINLDKKTYELYKIIDRDFDESDFFNFINCILQLSVLEVLE